jgi:hypothetical protein
MITDKHLQKIKKFIDTGADGINLAQSLLYNVALGEKLSPNFQNNPKARQVFQGLRRYKFVRRLKDNNYSLTPKGEARLRNIVIDEIEIKNPKKWDGKWRLVMYDLPVRFKKARDAFRWKLKDLGFFQFQKSAWIYPYPCEGELLFVADFYGVRKHIEILEVSKILDDKKLKIRFGL